MYWSTALRTTYLVILLLNMGTLRAELPVGCGSMEIRRIYGEERAVADGRVNYETGESDPNDASSTPGHNSAYAIDSDCDGLMDWEEDKNRNGLFEPLGTDGWPGTADDETDFLDGDTDDDGLSDYTERLLGTSPIDADSDDDGLPDGLEMGVTSIVEISGNRYTFTGGEGEIYIGSRGTEYSHLSPPTPSVPPKFLFYHPEHLYQEITVDGKEYPILRNCFIPDEYPSSRTDPLSKDTNWDGISDGISDDNHNGMVDPTEVDPSFGFAVKKKKYSVWSRTGKYYPVLEESDDVVDEESSIVIAPVLISSGEAFKNSGGIIILSVNPPTAGNCIPAQLSETSFTNGLATIEVILLESAELNISHEENLSLKGARVNNYNININPTQTESDMVQLVADLDETLSRWSVNRSWALTAETQALMWFINKGTVLRSYLEFHRKRVVMVYGLFNGNTLNPSPGARAKAFRKLVSLWAKKFHKYVPLQVNHRVSGASIGPRELETLDEYTLKRLELHISIAENDTGLYNGLVANLGGIQLRHYLFIYTTWNIFISPWAYDYFPNEFVARQAQHKMKFIFASLFGRASVRLRELRPSSIYLDHKPFFLDEFVSEDNPEDIAAANAQENATVLSTWYGYYTGRSWSPETGVQPWVDKAPLEDEVTPKVPYAGWDISRNHFDSDQLTKSPPVSDDSRALVFKVGGIEYSWSTWNQFPAYAEVRNHAPRFTWQGGRHPLNPRRRTGWKVDRLPDFIHIGDDDGRMDHFLNHMVVMPDRKIVETGELHCCACCDASTIAYGPENSLRDKVQNRLGALFAHDILRWELPIEERDIDLWLSTNLVYH